MTQVLPEVLFRTKRGLCPGCGTPLPLDVDAPSLTCPFCGQEAVLERRLRKLEPEVDGAPLRIYFDSHQAASGTAEPERAPWFRSPRLRQAVVERTVCPGCGDGIDLDDDDVTVTTVRCRSCGTDSRVERRLWAPPPDPATEVPRPRHPDEYDPTHDGAHDHETEHLIHRIVTEPDPIARVNLARRFDEWRFVNPTSARLLPALLKAARGAEPAFQWTACQLVCKLLCQGSPEIRNTTLRACERFLFDLDAPRTLVLELGMGDAAGLKLLLDAAEFATREGDIDFAAAALLAVDWMFQRNYGQHEVMGQILLYRMLYLSGPVLAYAFLIAQRQRIGFYFKAEVLLAFMDEAAVERPGLIAELGRCFYVGLPKDEEECRRRMAFFGTLKTDASRAAALREWVWPPEEAPEDVYRDLGALFLPLVEQPALREAAEEALRKLVTEPREVPAVVHELIASRGAALPVEMRRAYRQKLPDNPYVKYGDPTIPYWESPPAHQLTPELAKAKAQWDEGLDRAHARNQEIQQAAREVPHRDVKIFDGVHDGPAPVKERTRAPDRPQPEPFRVVGIDELNAMIRKLAGQ